MGFGDELMVAGEVRRHGVRCQIVDRDGHQRWHKVWEGDPLIARPGQGFAKTLANSPGRRPYIKSKTETQWTWCEYQPHPAALHFNRAEAAMQGLARGSIIIEPHIKINASPAKRWPVKNWQAMVDAAPDLPWVQCGSEGATVLRGVRLVHTNSFREACAVLSGAAAAVLHEGGLHHGAAAVGVPAVVIFGGYISPKVTGYEMHRNIFTGGEGYPLGCGMRNTCAHCMQAMTAITPERVLHELREILNGQHQEGGRDLVAGARDAHGGVDAKAQRGS
jgi:hypothetical protein